MKVTESRRKENDLRLPCGCVRPEHRNANSVQAILMPPYCKAHKPSTTEIVDERIHRHLVKGLIVEFSEVNWIDNPPSSTEKCFVLVESLHNGEPYLELLMGRLDRLTAGGTFKTSPSDPGICPENILYVGHIKSHD